MENFTIGQISAVIAFLVGLISGIIYLNTQVKRWLKNSFSDEFKKIDNKLNDLQEKIDGVDLESCKNYLVSILADIERGNSPDEIEMQRFWERYEHYTEQGGNTYIKRKVEKLKAEGRL